MATPGEQHVLNHYQGPRNKINRVATHRSEMCGDEITLYLRLAPGLKVRWYWSGEGCCFSQSAASMLVTHLSHKPLKVAHEFTEDDMIQLFQAEVPSARRDCVLVAWNALQALLKGLS